MCISLCENRLKEKKNSNRRRTLTLYSIYNICMYERFMHLAKVPNFVRRIMFELRLTQDIRVTIVRFFNVRPLFLLQPFLFSRRFQRFPVWELTQVKKRARRTVGCVCVRGLDDRRDVRMRGPAIDDEEAWDDQHSLFSILEAPNCHKKKITRAHDIVVRACIPRLSQSFLLEPRQRGSSSSSSTISPTTTVRTTS